MADSVTTGFGSPVLAPTRSFLAIGVGGFIVGALDLTYAILVYSPKHPILVMQTIAGGLLGERSYHGGVQAAVLGVALHFLIATGAATVYYLASRKIAFLVQNVLVSGIIYGALVYLFMHLIIVPLSALPVGGVPLVYKVCEFVEHLFCVGLPIAWSVRHFAK